MLDSGIVRNRAKIEATVALARIYLDLAGKGGFARHIWSFVDGRPIQNARRSLTEIPAETESLARHRQGPARAGRQFRRPHDHLRLHAGDRHGQRSPRRLLPPRRLPGAGARFRTVSELPRRRAWQRMLSGRRLDLIDPSPVDVEIADIAHGLARVARWNGQTQGPEIFSVAQHSLLVEALFAARRRLAVAEGAPRRIAARRARICDRRHDLAVQGGDRRRLQADRRRVCSRRSISASACPPSCRRISRNRSKPSTGSPPISRRRRLPGSRSPKRASFSASPRRRSRTSPPLSNRCGRRRPSGAFSIASRNSTHAAAKS